MNKRWRWTCPTCTTCRGRRRRRRNSPGRWRWGKPCSRNCSCIVFSYFPKKSWLWCQMKDFLLLHCALMFLLWTEELKKVACVQNSKPLYIKKKNQQSWEMKLRKEGSFLKIRQMSGSLQKPFSGGLRPMGMKATRKSVKGKLALGSSAISSPGYGVLQVSRKGKAGYHGFTTLQDIGDWMLSKLFRTSILLRKCNAWQWPLNKQTNKQTRN